MLRFKSLIFIVVLLFQGESFGATLAKKELDIHKTAALIGVITNTLLDSSSSSQSDLKLFKPFYPIGSGNFNLKSSFIYSFIITDGSSCTPYWDWAIGEDIKNFKSRVKNGVISFGGAGAEGKSLAYLCSESELLNAYKKIINTYHIKGFDFDIEGGMLDESEANRKRFKVLKRLQKIYSDIEISLTLAVMPEGFDTKVKNLINLAKAENLSIASYNLMLMDYGDEYPANDRNKTGMFDYSKSAIESANSDLKELFHSSSDFYRHLGAIAMIGVNDIRNEIFYRNDFTLLRDYVVKRNMPLLSFWAIMRDREGTDVDSSTGLSRSDYGKREYEYFNIGAFAEYKFASSLDKNDTFYWQLTGKIREDIPAKIYDIDMFETSRATIQRLKESGKVVICYLSAGSWEDWREDASDFPNSVKGKDLDGWAGEKWLDIRSSRVREIMMKRFDLAKQKGCDGIEPDNINGYQNDTGFPLTYNDQLNYNLFLAKEAKKRGLLIALKNDLDQTDELVHFYDFLIVESAIKYNETDKFLPFIIQNKPIYDIEYNQDDYNCSQAKSYHLFLMPRDLDGSFVKSCDYGNY